MVICNAENSFVKQQSILNGYIHTGHNDTFFIVIESLPEIYIGKYL